MDLVLSSVVKNTIFLLNYFSDNHSKVIEILKKSRFIIKNRLKNQENLKDNPNYESIKLYISLFKNIYSKVMGDTTLKIDIKELLSNLFVMEKYQTIKGEILLYIKKMEESSNIDEVIDNNLENLNNLYQYIYFDTSLDGFNDILNKWRDKYYDDPTKAVEDFKNVVNELFEKVSIDSQSDNNRYEVMFGNEDSIQQTDQLNEIKNKLKKFFDPRDKLPTQFEYFNYLQMGGLDKTRLYTITGRPGVGKSIFALNLFDHFATKFFTENKKIEEYNKKLDEKDGLTAIKKKKKYAFYITLENSYEETLFRLLACHHRIDSYELKKLLESNNEKDIKKLDKYLIEILDLPIVISYFQSGSITVNELISHINNKIKTQNIVPGIIIVDYLNLLRSDKFSEMRHSLTDITMKLKSMAISYRCPVITLTQMTKSSYDRNANVSEPSLGDIKEASGIIDNSDFVGMLTGYSFKEISEMEEYLKNNTKKSSKLFSLINKLVMIKNLVRADSTISKDIKENAAKIVILYIRKNRSAMEGNVYFLFVGNKLYFIEPPVEISELETMNMNIEEDDDNIEKLNDNFYDISDLDFMEDNINSIEQNNNVLDNESEEEEESSSEKIDLGFF